MRLENIYDSKSVSCLKKRAVLNNKRKSIQNLIANNASAILVFTMLKSTQGMKAKQTKFPNNTNIPTILANSLS
jgi:hypothetical protein